MVAAIKGPSFNIRDFEPYSQINSIREWELGNEENLIEC